MFKYSLIYCPILKSFKLLNLENFRMAHYEEKKTLKKIPINEFLNVLAKPVSNNKTSGKKSKKNGIHNLKNIGCKKKKVMGCKTKLPITK